MIKTPLCELLGIEYPVFQGGMAWISDAELAAAVSNGGGLGVIAGMNEGPEWLRGQIRRIRKLTDKPFGVNIMLKSEYAEQTARIAIEEHVPVVLTGAGSPARFMKDWTDAGIHVIPVIASPTMAKKVESCGAAAVVAEGAESGGHIGELTTMVLVPEVCDCVALPVVAAGGIADGRAVAAALMLGAAGVQIGTRFLCASECNVHPEYKRKILEASDLATVVTGKRIGHAMRSLRNKYTSGYISRECNGGTDEELLELVRGAFKRAAIDGDVENGCVLAGQSAAMVGKIQPAAEIIREIFDEAQISLKGAHRWVK